MNGTLVSATRESGYAPDALRICRTAMIEQAEPSGVVAAIFEPTQASKSQWGAFFLANISNDAAHVLVIGNQ